MNRKSAGVSPVISTTIIIAITVTLGLALFAFANSQANVTTQAYSQEVTDYINYRNDRFVVTALTFQGSGCGSDSLLKSNCTTIHVFNSGQLPVKIKGAVAGKDSDTAMTKQCIIDSSGFVLDSVTINPKELVDLSFAYSSIACDSQPGDPVSTIGMDSSGLSTASVYFTKTISETGAYQPFFAKFSR